MLYAQDLCQANLAIAEAFVFIRQSSSYYTTSVEAEVEAEEVEQAVDDEDIEEAEDPDEPKYCYCGQGSFGEMIAYDNDDCPMEWFHLGCTGLRAVPGDNGEYSDMSSLMQRLTQSSVKWFCDVCKEPKGRKARMMAARH